VNAPGERKVVLVTRRDPARRVAGASSHARAGPVLHRAPRRGFSTTSATSAAYAQSLRVAVEALASWGRYQLLDRAYLPNFVFARDDIVVALGQDGLVANTMKYLDGQPLIGVNPEPSDGTASCFPSQPPDLPVADPRRRQRPAPAQGRHDGRSARCSDGQRLRAVNDLFIGPRSHTSALYEIELGERHESQSSSGLIVSTGLGSTAWLKSIVTGSWGIADARVGRTSKHAYRPQPWARIG
jgi:NAD kinase